MFHAMFHVEHSPNAHLLSIASPPDRPTRRELHTFYAFSPIAASAHFLRGTAQGAKRTQTPASNDVARWVGIIARLGRSIFFFSPKPRRARKRAARDLRAIWPCNFFQRRSRSGVFRALARGRRRIFAVGTRVIQAQEIGQ